MCPYFLNSRNSTAPAAPMPSTATPMPKPLSRLFDPGSFVPFSVGRAVAAGVAGAVVVGVLDAVALEVPASELVADASGAGDVVSLVGSCLVALLWGKASLGTVEGVEGARGPASSCSTSRWGIRSLRSR